MLRRVQYPNESVMSYVQSILEMCRIVDPMMRETDQVSFLIRGFIPPIREHLFLCRPVTVDTCIQEAERKEESLRFGSGANPWYGSQSSNMVPSGMFTAPMHPTMPMGHVAMMYPDAGMVNVMRPTPSPNDVMVELLQQLKELRMEANRKGTNGGRGGPRNLRTVDGQPICNYCHKAGHFARECSERLARKTAEQVKGDSFSGPGNGPAGSAAQPSQ